MRGEISNLDQNNHPEFCDILQELKNHPFPLKK